MDYKVIWEDDAISDLARCVRYVAENNPAAAIKLGEVILKKVAALASFPRLGKVFAKLDREDVREVPKPPYRIIYRVEDSRRLIRVLAVWHGARQEPMGLGLPE
jgi:plasmid stabilization system protein ParE